MLPASLPPPSGDLLAACKAAQLALWRGWLDSSRKKEYGGTSRGDAGEG